MSKSQLYVKQLCLPIIRSIITNNIIELWKTVSQTGFEKAQLQSVLIFFKFVHPRLRSYMLGFLYLLLILSLPNVVKGKFRPYFQISFFNIVKTKRYHVKVQEGSFHLNGHIVGFRPQTQKLQSPFKTPSSTLAVNGLTFWVVVFKVLSIWWQFPPFEFRSILWHSFFWGPCVVVIFENLPFVFFHLVDGGYTNWTPWTSCSKSCGGGTRVRDRVCTNPPPSNNGQPCSGASYENENCNTQPCPGESPCFKGLHLNNFQFWKCTSFGRNIYQNIDA